MYIDEAINFGVNTLVIPYLCLFQSSHICTKHFSINTYYLNRITTGAQHADQFFFFNAILGKIIDISEKNVLVKEMCYLQLNLLKLLTMIIKVDDLPFFFLHKKQVCLPLPLKIKFAMKNGLLFPSFLQWAQLRGSTYLFIMLLATPYIKPNIQQMILEKLKAVVATMYDFHDSTDVFVNSSFLPFLTQKHLYGL